MNANEMLRLKSMHIAPYIQIATALIGKRRKGGGNMFRHQIDTMGILIDYGYIDSVLLKASMIHDLVEDVPDFDRDAIVSVDDEGPEVYKLVLEVTRRIIETKAEFLTRIYRFGSSDAKILKSADRISNMISLGYVTDIDFIKRYTDETVEYIFPIARQANRAMFEELSELVRTRREFLMMCFNA
jgi:(p)ppGpp synthase/HD superfamily hydrolase